MKKIIGVIPARFNSSRFPGKPLELINNIPMIVRVYNQALKAENINDLFVATDDERILNCCKKYDIKCIITGECVSGTDRVYQVSKIIQGDVYVNIQGDEPLIPPDLIDSLVQPFLKNKSISVTTGVKKIINTEELNSPNVVKAVFDKNNFALYFSRSLIPFNRDNVIIDHYKHIGIYAYTKEALTDFFQFDRGILEKSENLEQLRFLENGYKIFVIETEYDSIGVDVIEDIKKVENALICKGDL